MTHARTNLRNAVIAALIGSDVAGSRVYSNRSNVVDEASLPAINVVTLPETSTQRDLNSSAYMRKLTLNIELKASDVNDVLVADVVDNFAETIEAAMAADPTFAGMATNVALTGTNFTKEIAGDIPIGVLTLNYQATYFA